MVYRIFHFLFSLVVKVYFKKIYTHALKAIPQHQPLIICSNHGNSFLDAILLAVLIPRKIHFLARADVFNSPVKRWFLKRLNMMPIYRLRDGREALTLNNEIFDVCATLLMKNEVILIFPEGNCVVEKRLRTFKSGIADLALKNNLKNIAVLPLVIDYEKPYRLQTRVSIKALPLIFVDKLNPDDELKHRKQQLLKSIQSNISAQMLIIPDVGDDDFYEFMFELYQQTLSHEIFVDTSKKILKHLEKIKAEEYELFLKLKDEVQELESLLQNNSISLKAFQKLSAIKMIGLIFMFPLTLMGFLVNYLPSFWVGKVLKQIKDKQFISAVRMVSTTFIYIIYMMLIFLLLLIFTDDSLYFLVLLFTSMIHYGLAERYQVLIHKIRLKLLKMRFQDKYKRIMTIKNKFLNVSKNILPD
jgi:1-acyl-sn-glycerol-3-phosphate acyltransferase